MVGEPQHTGGHSGGGSGGGSHGGSGAGSHAGSGASSGGGSGGTHGGSGSGSSTGGTHGASGTPHATHGGSSGGSAGGTGTGTGTHPGSGTSGATTHPVTTHPVPGGTGAGPTTHPGTGTGHPGTGAAPPVAPEHPGTATSGSLHQPTDTPTHILSHGQPGQEVPPQDVHRFGVDPTAAQHIQERLAEMPPGSHIDVRPGSEHAMEQRMHGAAGPMEMPKPRAIHPNEWMIGIGARGDQGLTGFGQPQLLERPPGMSDAEWSQREAVKPADMTEAEWQSVRPELQSYIDSRLQEYEAYGAAMERAQLEPFMANVGGVPQQVLMRISDGSVGWDSVAGPQRLGPGTQYLVDAGTGQFVAPIAGGVGGLSVYNPEWGPPGTPAYTAAEGQFLEELAAQSGGAFQPEVTGDLLLPGAPPAPAGVEAPNVLRLTSEGAFTARP